MSQVNAAKQTVQENHPGPSSPPPKSSPHPAPSNGKPPQEAPIPISSLPSPDAPVRRRWPLLAALVILPLVALVLVGGSGAAWSFLPTWKTARADIIPYTVHYETLQLSIVERGTLESAQNHDIVCRVKAGTKGSTVATTIKWVIDDGTEVKRGQLVCELDDSGLQEQLKAEKIILDQARAASVSAEENYKIVVSQNESDLKTAEIAIELAELSLGKYTGEGVTDPRHVVSVLGTLSSPSGFGGLLTVAQVGAARPQVLGEYKQALDDVTGRIKLAEADVEMATDRLAWSERMLRKGYLTSSQAQAERSKLESTRESLKKVQNELFVLKNYTRQFTETDLRGKVAEAKRALDRVKTQARAKEIQADSDRQSKESIYHQEEAKYHEIEDEIRKCTLTAPLDGLVVYFVPEQSRFGSGSRQSIIAQGEPVSEGQKLMRIPDLTRMLVNARVHEALVRRVHGEKYQRTGFIDSVRAGMLMNPSSMSRWLSLHAFTSLDDQFQEQDLRKTYDGQRAQVRCESAPDRMLKGHVKQVATVASQTDWLSSDVKVYQTMVSIDEPVEGLKPGMSAEVTIVSDDGPQNVLAIPLQAIVGSVEMGPQRECYVMKPGSTEPEKREITVGMTNDKMAEVRSGLVEGEVVVMNPRALPQEKNRLKSQPDTPQGPGKEGGGKGPGKGMGKGKQP